MATRNSDHQYDCGFRFKGQGQIYLNSVFWLSTRAPTAFFIESVHIWHNDCIWCFNYNEGFRSLV